ncbi:MAG: acylphosphatase, partial [Cyclobacteriaceae bacterium]|nr:acylphosphatase [Cyclobacteriaceae bacterium]
MTRYHIHIQGRVQGVGFRPFIFREAQKRGLKGWVSNTRDGVHIEVLAGDEGIFKEFCVSIRNNCPDQARIEFLHHKVIPYQDSGDFTIRMSDGFGVTDLSLTPDFAICNVC